MAVQTPQAQPPTLLTVTQVRRHLPLSERAIRGLIASRALPVVRVGRRVFVNLEDLRTFLNDRRSSRW